MFSFRSPLVVTALVTSGLLVGCGSDEHATEAAKPAIQVTVAEVSPSRDAAGNLVLSGQVQASRRAELSTRVMGTLVSLSVEEGQAVREGQVLGQIRSTDVQASRNQVDAQIQEVEAVVANAKRDLDRFEALYAKGSATQKELDDVRTGYARAQAQLEAARQGKAQVETQLGYATLVAPFSGYVTHKFMQQGALATPGMPILTLEGGAGFKLVARVAEQDIAGVRPGQTAQVTVEALGEGFPATVTRITPSTTFTGAQYEVTLAAKSYPKGLIAGMFLRARLAGAPQPGSAATWVPDSVLVHRGGLTGIYVVSPGGEALLRWVRTGATEKGQVEIRSGLSQGDRYIVRAAGRLEDGVPVTVSSTPVSTR
ncbi:MAG: efflux RND transporter periplasmic adaptor subunit [Bacteroidia bacterium]|nr:efflux RND transporter periplasmic adaptor subunit [Bacteroidia bacterium]